ncbi:MAG: DNA-binding protein [Acidobacteriota bacterium]|nr:DNA-binding protein [Acidobacteriota bacterium]
MTAVDVLNEQIARRLEEVASLYNEQRANAFRIAAWRRAATTIRRLSEPLATLYSRDGIEGLRRLPGVGPQIASALRSILTAGTLPLLERLRREMSPVDILRSVPGIGRVQAGRLHRDLAISTLEDLELAAHDGRLAAIAGFGPKRIAGIADSLASRLSRVRPAEPRDLPEVSVADLLAVDRDYREQAAAGTLRRIAPRRFNPNHEPWLPILHTERGGRRYTALFSNTALAHKSGMTHDWVVLYWDGGAAPHQCTVVTARQGKVRGQRAVRGREEECAAYYAGTVPRVAA